MAITVNSIQSFVSVGRPGSNRQTTGTLDGRLSVTSSGGGDSASVNSSRSPDDTARRGVTLRLSSSVSTLNTREAFVEQQSTTVTALLAKAREIKRETDPTRRQSLIEDAQAIIAGAEEDYASAVESDSSFDDTIEVTARTDSDSDPSSSAGTFSTSISGVQSLSELAVTEVIGFGPDDIDATIEILGNAQQSLATKLQSFDSTRAAISNEVSTRGVNARLEADLASTDSIEQVASRLAAEITSSTDRLLQSSRVEQLDVSSLLDEQAEEQQESESESVSA